MVKTKDRTETVSKPSLNDLMRDKNPAASGMKGQPAAPPGSDKNPLQKKSEETLPVSNVIRRIRDSLGSLTSSQRLLAEYLLQNPAKAGFLPINELAEKAGVSGATIVRFCHKLGYDGYGHLGRVVQQQMQAEMSTLGRFKLGRDVSPLPAEKGPSSFFERVIIQEMENLSRMVKSIKKEDYYQTVKWMAEADRVLIVGAMASAALAAYFGYMTSKILPIVRVLTTAGERCDQFASLSPESVVFLLAFPRYPRETIKIGQAAKDMGCRIVVITDTHLSPVVSLGDIVFYIPIGIPSLIDAYAAPISFLRALASELSDYDPGMTEQALNRFETYVDRMKLFYYPDNGK